MRAKQEKKVTSGSERLQRKEKEVTSVQKWDGEVRKGGRKRENMLPHVTAPCGASAAFISRLLHG